MTTILGVIWIFIESVCVYFLIRVLLLGKIIRLMGLWARLDARSGNSINWFIGWNVNDFVFKHPFTFRIRNYVYNVREKGANS